MSERQIQKAQFPRQRTPLTEDPGKTVTSDLAAAAQGDAEKWGVLHDRHFKSLVKSLQFSRGLFDLAEIEDAASDTLLEMLGKIELRRFLEQQDRRPGAFRKLLKVAAKRRLDTIGRTKNNHGRLEERHSLELTIQRNANCADEWPKCEAQLDYAETLLDGVEARAREALRSSQIAVREQTIFNGLQGFLLTGLSKQWRTALSLEFGESEERIQQRFDYLKRRFDAEVKRQSASLLEQDLAELERLQGFYATRLGDRKKKRLRLFRPREV